IPKIFVDEFLMLIRPANRTDIPWLQSLAQSIWNAVYPSIISQAQIDFMLAEMYNPKQIETEMASGYEWDMAEEGGVAIGFLSTLVEKTETGSAMKLSKIYLEPAYHGRGFGQRMLQHAEAKAKKAGAGSIYLYVNRYNSRGIRAYQRAGYSIAET